MMPMFRSIAAALLLALGAFALPQAAQAAGFAPAAVSRAVGPASPLRAGGAAPGEGLDAGLDAGPGAKLGAGFRTP